MAATSSKVHTVHFSAGEGIRNLARVPVQVVGGGEVGLLGETQQDSLTLRHGAALAQKIPGAISTEYSRTKITLNTALTMEREVIPGVYILVRKRYFFPLSRHVNFQLLSCPFYLNSSLFCNYFTLNFHFLSFSSPFSSFLSLFFPIL